VTTEKQGADPAYRESDVTDEADTVSAPADASASTASALAEPHPRRRLIFFIVSIALFMASVDQTIVATALSPIERELHAGIQWGGWVITIYALGQVLVMPLAGKISDIYGKKRVFLAAAVIFTAASLLCGLSVNIYMLVALRAVQAIGGGAFMPSASGLVSDHFGAQRDRAIGMFSSIFPIGAVVGPILGGVFVTFWSWRGIFLINVPIGIGLIVLGVIFFPKSVRGPRSSIDFYGVLLVGVGIVGAMFGITYLGDPGASALSPTFLISEAVAVIAIWLFLRHARRAKNSFISMRLLFGRGFGTMNLLNFLSGAAALGFAALVPIYAQERFGIPVLAAGTLLTARAIGMILIASAATLALRRTGYRLPMFVGSVVIAAGLVMMAIVPAGISPYLWLSIGACVSGLGMGMSIPASNNAVLHLAPDQVAGVSGLRGMFRQSGAIIAVSIATAAAARSTDPGLALAYAFVGFAIILVLSLPLVFRVPEHRGSW
jgi:EmrB/QacA subfamily drug resistance transporter